METAIRGFSEAIQWIGNQRKRNSSWAFISKEDNEEEYNNWMERKVQEDAWERISFSDWQKIVSYAKNNEMNRVRIENDYITGTLIDENADNTLEVPTYEFSAWIKYKEKLQQNGFDKDSLVNIEKSTSKALKRLNIDNNFTPKGIVIGNVQSGKTANMAALIAMAADHGWNLFIILSGTIENLRVQTQERLLSDMHGCGNWTWHGINQPEPNGLNDQPQYLDFNKNGAARYICVSLKNSARIKKLIQWLQKDKNKYKQMRILVIDDEADQASINTKAYKNEESKISKLIKNLVDGKSHDGKEIQEKFSSMNYMAYTATPYANLLNESKKESLYPSNFIHCLAISKKYFGPQQIFGCDGTKYRGLDIVRKIDETEVKNIFENEEEGAIPLSLAKSIYWFLCAAAAMRTIGYKKPVTMLVHPSSNQTKHDYFYDIVKKILSEKDILKSCEEVWSEETSEFTVDDFKNQYSDYLDIDKIVDYPPFDDIKDNITELLSEISHIKLDSDDNMKYCKGIHLCIDNCKYTGIDEGRHIRLKYPSKSDSIDYSTAFIVIGGDTLSRGLTIEGLVSTYFGRQVCQGDSLMQMGRWFGYRVGYEMYPRIWMDDKTRSKFEFLSKLDWDLRLEIKSMEERMVTPDKYAVKLNSSPKYIFLKITASNKQANAKPCEFDFTGSTNQTVIFDKDDEIIDKNLQATNEFVSSLGDYIDCATYNSKSENNYLFENVDLNEKILPYLTQNMIFSKRARVFNEIKYLCQWIREISKDKLLDKWNVIIIGKNKKEEKMYTFNSGLKITKVNRTKKSETENAFSIGVLRGPEDLLSDVKYDELCEEGKNLYDNFKTESEGQINRIRSLAGLSETPQLLIYIIDKDSEPGTNSKGNKRMRLELNNDLVGICINIPGGKNNSDYIKKISVKLENEEQEAYNE